MIEYAKSKIRDIPNFPKEGIVFKDITTLIKDKKAFKITINELYNYFKDKNIDYVVAIESRGYLFGAPLAYQLDAGLVVVRKPGKLPAKVAKIEYDLEYGTDSLEIHLDAIEKGKRVVIIDDLLATGGTVGATCKLVENLGANIVSTAFIIELEFLNGRSKIANNIDVYSMIKY